MKRSCFIGSNRRLPAVVSFAHVLLRDVHWIVTQLVTFSCSLSHFPSILSLSPTNPQDIFSFHNSFLSLGSTFLIPFHPILDTLSFFFYFYLYITTRNYLSHLLLFSSLQEFQQLSISRSFLSCH